VRQKERRERDREREREHILNSNVGYITIYYYFI
jgi:hypothetical protein